MTRKPFIHRTLLILAFLGTIPALAQTKKPAVTASLIPVGSNSDAYWVGDGPGVKAIAIDPDAAPPSTLCIRVKSGFKVIPGSLNRPSIALPVTAGILRVFANQDQGVDEDPPLFGEFKIPTIPGHYDVFLNRASNRKNWQDAQSMILSSSTQSFPTGAIRLVNLCNEPIKAKVGTSIVTLPARRSQLVRPPTGDTSKLIAVQAVRANDAKATLILRTGIKLNASQRANLVFYPGRTAKKPAQATWFHQAEPEMDPETKVPEKP